MKITVLFVYVFRQHAEFIMEGTNTEKLDPHTYWIKKILNVGWTNNSEKECIKKHRYLKEKNNATIFWSGTICETDLRNTFTK